MASGAAAAFKAAAVVSVFAVLALSSHGHPKTGPLCSQCASQCNTNCTASAAANCNSYCSAPSGCQSCIDQVLQGCQNCCNNSTSSSDCCGNGCAGDCVTCGCDCNSIVGIRCAPACKPNYLACQACKNAVGQQCHTSCNSACNDNCVKKDHGC
ncbi:uncharacterized protein LOC133903967 [Phragmites australis]|uniref:uncharacterized protein LOC133903967 n=1 Tax=Phragmites australis TaxID=29695 RepID=UPI002D779AA5|nr:uncharacterized protein LOC133903967 [Phragmites australis]